jgi:predicted N-formylglutamate amidohydrolase
MLSETAAMDGRAADCGGLASASPVITCEHGGNRIPAPYRDLFHAHQALLDSHRGYDPGALIMARALATAFAAPLVASTVSRLLVDLNRSVGHPRLHSEAARKAPAEVRQQILKHYYQPYRAQAERFVRQAIADHGLVIHLSSHSFTPELDGKIRDADIGLLYDPARPGEADLCERWKASLEDCAPDLTVRRNYPYAGKGDGLTAWFRRCLPAGAYVGIELEVNQKHVVRAGRHWTAMRKVIVESLCRALASRCAGISDPTTKTARACSGVRWRSAGPPP